MQASNQQQINLRQYNGTLDIAIGGSRKELHWKNNQRTWLTFLEQISQTHFTAETHKEYMAAKPARQDEIKDIGGFVFGEIVNGRRKKENILHRSAIALDLDTASQNFWEDFLMLYDNAAAIYSTHKHTPEKPRLRFIVPLDRTVSPEEYEAISRKLAGTMGIEQFDGTTFEAERLMYWPSTSKGAEYIFEYQDGPVLSADQVLSLYHNWKDVSEWPRSDQEDELIQRDIKKQADPLEKPGIVGAFCRQFSIHQAIDTFLSDIYTPCEQDNRYTYTGGSTASGLVVYNDGRYAYSNHNSDPATRKLCNAFDLVRIHLYGLRDEEAKEGTPSHRLKSFEAMEEKARNIPEVKILLGMEKLSESKKDFSEAPDDQDSDWMKELDFDKKGNILSSISNIYIILQNDPVLKGTFAMDKFEQREVAKRDLPWKKDTKYLTDSDDANLRKYLDGTYGITGAYKISDALQVVIQENSFHPVRTYLDSLAWDKVERLETLFIDYLGAEDSPYTRAVTKKALVAAVARIYNPGCKFDYVLVIVGKQGTGKSTILKKLGQAWYSDSFSGFNGKEAYEAIQGVWILEMAELAGLNKAEFEQTKHFISKSEDRFRVAYGKRIESFPRQCAFIGTTNTSDFLRDPTGNRRFWPVTTGITEPIKSVFDDLTAEVIDQIFAEAKNLYSKGESLFLPAKLEQDAFNTQVLHRQRDERHGLIQEFLDTELPVEWDFMDIQQRAEWLRTTEDNKAKGEYEREKVSVAEIWCELFKKPQAEMNRNNTKDIHSIMRTMEGWEEINGPANFGIYGKQRGYKRQESVNTKTKNIENVNTNTFERQHEQHENNTKTKNVLPF